MGAYLKSYDFEYVPREAWLCSVLIRREVARTITGAVRIRTQGAGDVAAVVGMTQPLMESKSSNS